VIDAVREAAYRNGFQAVSVWPVGSLAHEQTLLQRWLDLGYSAGMTYLQRHAARGLDPRALFPWARAVVVLLVRWDSLHRCQEGPWADLVASYARGPDYHPVIMRKLGGIIRELRFDKAAAQVDATALPERALAHRAGLGWIGRNRFLIHPELGGDLCIAELVVDSTLQEAEPEPQIPLCGECTACIDACPTGALTREGVDARRCLSYHTTQNRGIIPLDLRESLTTLMGCDLCLQACPHGNAAVPVDAGASGFLGLLLAARTRDDFLACAGNSPVAYCKREAAVRSAAVVAATRRRDDLVQVLGEATAGDPSPLVRGHAAWALGRLGGSAARAVLARRHGTEPEPWVRSEIAAALEA
jgi:epoxyqueuosine reductase